MNLLDKMFNGKVKATATTNTKPAYVLKDSVNKANQGIILFNDSDVQHILNKSGKHAESNEYQVHYWGLIFRHTAEDGSILDICIPTVFFNYKQQVSPAHIDFELSDVDDTSDAVLPIHEMKVKEILASNFKEDIERYFQITLEPLSVAINSLHCHPGTNTNQSFSGTDLSKRAEDLGVVFPLASAENNRPNFAGIMVRKTKSNNVIAHYEYRIANGTLNQDIQYQQGRCAALISKQETRPSLILSMFGEEPKVNNYSVMKYCTMNEHFENIQSAFDQIGFEAFTDSVIPDNVELKHSQTRSMYVNPHYRENYDLFDEPYQSKQHSSNKTLSIYDSGITKKEYEDAKSNIEQFEDFKVIPLKQLEKYGFKQLMEYYEKWHIELYGKEDYDLYQELSELGDDVDIVDELVFECLTLTDSIQEYISELKETIEIYEKENNISSAQKSKIQTEYDIEQEILTYMRDGLIENGWAKSVIALKTNDEIEELYNKLTTK